jgi:Family of unknown function (DUF6056)
MLQKSFYENAFNVALLFLTLLPLVALSFYNHPSHADDYCYIMTVNIKGWWGGMHHYYEWWTGRYFGILLNHSNPLLFHWYVGFKLLPILLLMGFVGSLYALVRALLPRGTRWFACGATGLLFFLYIYQMVSIPEAFYWMAAFVTYTIPNLMTIYWLAVMVQWYRQPKGVFNVLTGVWAGFLVFASIGCSETNLVITALLVVSWFGYQLLINSRFDVFAFSLILVAALGCYLSFSSPGNLSRIEGNPVSRDYVASALASALFLSKSLKGWLLHTPLLMATGLFLLLIPSFTSRSDGTPQPYFAVHPVWSGLLMLGLLMGIIFPSYFGIAVQVDPTPRVVNCVYLYFLLGWFYNVGVWASFAQRRNWLPTFNASTAQMAKWTLAAAIAGSCLFSSNIKHLYSDWLRGRAAQFDAQMTARYDTIRTAKTDVVYVEPIKNRPISFYYEDMSADTTHWWNKCTAHYFGKKAIILKSDKP